MASAGQAHAHSSQPMHFSRRSGQRLSWCRPWKRGAVGCFSKGYCSVTTFLNIVRKVTPKPATGSQNCSLRVGIVSVTLPIGGGGHGRRTAGLAGELAGDLGGQRRDRVAAGERVELPLVLGRSLARVVPLADEEHHQEQRRDDAD